MSITRTQHVVMKSLKKTLETGMVEYRDEYNRIHSVSEIDVEAGKIQVINRVGHLYWVPVFFGPEYVQDGNSSKVIARIMHGDPAVLGARVKIRFGETKKGFSRWY